MERIFYPNSIVVIGVSDRPDNLARNIIANLCAFGYGGQLYAVGRREGEVHGIRIVASLDHIPDNLDLAVILTPASIVPGLIEICGHKGIHRVVIESGGFSEFSEEGRHLEEQLLAVARKWHIRFVGPNCISVVNLENGVCLPFSILSPDTARLGPVSVVAQSGGVSLTYMGQLCNAGIGVNKVISIGNKADLDEIDYLSYLLDDESTEMVCLYLESVSNGRQLMNLAHASPKPIIIHKANRGQASQAIAFSHTAALANDDQIVSAAFRQAGILRAEGFRDLVAIAQGLTLPPVHGRDLVIISRSGGHAVAAADAAERHGFMLHSLPKAFIENVRSHFRADVITLTNPLDLGVIFDFDIYAQIVELSLRSLSPDAVLLINTYSHTEQEGARRLANRVRKIIRESNQPIALCIYSQRDEVQEIQSEIGLPVFNDLEVALRGLAANREWNRRRAIQTESAPALIESTLPTITKSGLQTGLLTTDHALTLCRNYGIPVAPWETASHPEEAASAAERLGFPVALKILSTAVTHKSDVGGVVLRLTDTAAVNREAKAMLTHVTELGMEAHPITLLVQRMVPDGIEVILGGKQDPSFGPVIMFGLGGIHVEIFNDVVFRVAPISQADAEAMIEEVRGARLIQGIRGEAPMDREALMQAILSLSQLMVENSHISELDINPLIITEDGAIAVDARAVIVERNTCN